jgi:hypothetical protein
MKRLIPAVLAIAIVLLYPSSYSIAGSPAANRLPNVISSYDQYASVPGSGFINYTSGNGGGGDSGDADDLAGSKRNYTVVSNTEAGEFSVIQARIAVKIWWIYFFTHKIF